MSNVDLRNQHVVITGASRGIGLAIARECVKAGAVVSGMSRAGTSESGIDAIHCDVADPSSITQAFAAARDRHGPVTMLVNNAGIAASAPIWRTSDELWERILATNLTGSFRCIRAAIDDMRHAKFGRIVNIASIAGLYGAPYIAAYCASKHGVVGLTRALAAEFAGSGISIHAICPGYTETDMMQQAVEQIVAHTGASAEEARAQLAEMNPSGRIIEVAAVARTAVELLGSDRNGEEVVLA